MSSSLSLNAYFTIIILKISPKSLPFQNFLPDTFPLWILQYPSCITYWPKAINNSDILFVKNTQEFVVFVPFFDKLLINSPYLYCYCYFESDGCNLVRIIIIIINIHSYLFFREKEYIAALSNVFCLFIVPDYAWINLFAFQCISFHYFFFKLKASGMRNNH